MEHRIISENQLTLFAQKMREDERSPGTIENYVRHVRAFAAWMGGITPARAGKSRFARLSSSRWWDHPRACGEKCLLFSRKQCL